jgi:hypothetical protein
MVRDTDDASWATEGRAYDLSRLVGIIFDKPTVDSPPPLRFLLLAVIGASHSLVWNFRETDRQE